MWTTLLLLLLKLWFQLEKLIIQGQLDLLTQLDLLPLFDLLDL
jgi:hypothetical protein